jgi:hypothetical protein
MSLLATFLAEGAMFPGADAANFQIAALGMQPLYT